MGTKPSDDTVDRDNADRTFIAKSRKDKSEFLETIKDCEYMCARLEKIISKSQVKYGNFYDFLWIFSDYEML